MKRGAKLLLPLGLTGLLLGVFQNCSKADFGLDGASYDSLNAAYGGPAICDPLGGGKGASLSDRNGLVGRLFYEPAANVTKYGAPKNIEEMLVHSNYADATLFMSQINVPTRKFTEGFSADGGLTALADPTTGERLVEYFGIDMNSILKLGPGDAAGYYQFATISDDGSLLSVIENGVKTPLVGITTQHSTLALCSSRAIYLDSKSALAINYLYSQGPKDAIASVLAWRKVSSATPEVGDECNATNNWNFFEADPKATSAVTTPWQKMQSRGWTVIAPDNFFLPSDAPKNPCN